MTGEIQRISTYARNVSFLPASRALIPLFLLPVLLLGCGANGTLTHARASETIGNLLSVAGPAMTVARRQQLDSVSAAVEALPIDEQIRSVTRIHETWRVVGVAHDALVSALRTYVEAINADAADAELMDTLLGLLRPVMGNYVWLQRMLQEVDLNILPDIPPFILALAGGE